MQTQLEFRNLIELFNKSLKQIRSLDKQCLEIVRAERQEKLTFAQLKTRAEDFALWLILGADIQIGEKVTILGKNRTDWDVALWGTILAGAVPVLIDPERRAGGVMNHLLHTDSRLLVMADDYQDAESRRELRDFTTSRGLSMVEMTDTPCRRTPRSGHPPCCKEIGSECAQLLSRIGARVGADDTAVVLCTSGTTADPREVELTHANLIANIQGSVEKVEITGKDKLGHILPPHHSFGLTVGKLLPFCVGATNIYTNKYRQISELIRDMEITIFVAVPALFTVLAKTVEDNLAKAKRDRPLVRLLDRCLPKLVGRKIIKRQGWTKLRFFLSGSAAIPRWVLDVFWTRGLLLYEGYGTTENSPVYGYNDSPNKLGSVGKPIRTIFVRIVDEKNQVLPPSKKGEIALGGPCIMKGYYKNTRATEAIISTDRSGVRWLRTGDLGYMDEDGNLFITGRKKYVIVLPGGKNVNPELVESALSEARFVNEILVVPGLEQKSTGIAQETIRAIVLPAWDAIETHTSLRYTDLVRQPQILRKLVWQSINECQQKNRQLSHFEKVSPRHLEIKIDEFHKTSTGKIRREMYVKV